MAQTLTNALILVVTFTFTLALTQTFTFTILQLIIDATTRTSRH